MIYKNLSISINPYKVTLQSFFNFLVSSDFPEKEYTLIPLSAKYFSEVGVFSIDKAAKNITTANSTIKNKSLVIVK